ncbi:MAG TPA: glycosyltransferase family 39 protein [Coleofasciculaceae cyanobacterium]
MRSKLTKKWVLPPTGLRFLIIVLLALSILLRFVNLDRKIYWMDETYTSLRISGYTEEEVAQQLLKGQVIGIQDLHKYQRTNSEKSVVDTIKGLAKEEPQLAPLYFIMVRFWVQLLGNSVAITRSFSAFLSLLTLPCIYWLCLELFESSLVGWFACTLIAISPFQLVYAQEARQYSLWTLAIVLSSASLLRAIRINTWRSWSLYAATVTLGLYSHLFFVLVAIAHAIYVFATNNWAQRKTRIAYLLASLAAIIAFLPWIIVFIINYKQALTMTEAQIIRQPLSYFFKSWLGNLSRNFLDTGFSSTSPYSSPLPLLIILTISIFFIVLLLSYSVYFLCSTTPKTAWLFILSLTVFTPLAIIIPDLILGRRTSVTGRYMIPCYIGIQLAVSYLLASKINLSSVSQNKFWRFILLTLLSSGAISCAVVSQSETLWNNLTDPNNRQLSQIINQPSSPLVIQEIDYLPPRYNVFNLISLSYLLEPKVQFKFIAKNTTTEVPKGFNTVFFFDPSNVLKVGIEEQYKSKIEPIEPTELKLWKLKTMN